VSIGIHLWLKALSDSLPIRGSNFEKPIELNKGTPTRAHERNRIGSSAKAKRSRPRGLRRYSWSKSTPPDFPRLPRTMRNLAICLIVGRFRTFFGRENLQSLPGYFRVAAGTSADGETVCRSDDLECHLHFRKDWTPRNSWRRRTPDRPD